MPADPLRNIAIPNCTPTDLWIRKGGESSDDILAIALTDDPETEEKIPVILHGPKSDPLIHTEPSRADVKPLSETSHITILLELAQRQPIDPAQPWITEPWYDSIISDQYYAQDTDAEGRRLNDIELIFLPGTKAIHAWRGDQTEKGNPTRAMRIAQLEPALQRAISIGLHRLRLFEQAMAKRE